MLDTSRPERRDLPAPHDARNPSRPVAGDVEHALVLDVRVRATIDIEILREQARGRLHDLVGIHEGLRRRIQRRQEPVPLAKLAQLLL